MTITSLPSRNEYTATAGQTVFAYTFKIYESTDLNVYVTPAAQDANDVTDIVIPSAVTGVGGESGGTVTIAATNAGDRVTIVSDIPSSRTTDYQNNGDFRPTVVNADFDRVVSLSKQVEDLAGRTVVFEESQQNAQQLGLPTPVGGGYLRWNASLTGLENASVPALLISEISYVSVADMQSATNLSIGDIVETVAYCSTLDGGGANYEIVAAGTGTHDGGSYIDLPGSGLQAKLLPAKLINVLQWGVHPDNSAATNDTA